LRHYLTLSTLRVVLTPPLLSELHLLSKQPV
jgi:hypothetical protein